MYDHQAAIVQIGVAEILLVVIVVAIVSALVCAVGMHTRMNPYVQDRQKLLDGHDAVATVAVNLKNLATFVGAAAILRDNPEEADEFGRRMDEVIADMRTLHKKKSGDDPN